jgi:lipid II:glycine glycyltransferase (peptidoglycan interpeptide bridge formation enzyme)
MKIIKNEKELNIQLPILASEKYLSCKSNDYGWIVDNDFILPFIIDKRFIFKRMVFTDKLISLGNYSIDKEKSFLNKMIRFVQNQNICDFIAKPQANVFFNICPDNVECIEWGSYITNIQKDDEELLRSFHSKHRNVIRKAMKEGVIIETTNNLELVYENIKDTLVRQKSPFFPSIKYIECLKKSNLVLMLIAKKEEVIQGSALIVYDKKRGYYMYGGSIPKPFTGSLNLLHYEAMKILRDKGVKEYDFVGARFCVKKGSKYEGIQRFKSRFGTTIEKGYVFRKVFNPVKFKIFHIMAKNYLRLKGLDYEDTIDNIKNCK